MRSPTPVPSPLFLALSTCVDDQLPGRVLFRHPSLGMKRGVSRTSPRDIRKAVAGAASVTLPRAFLRSSELGSITDASFTKARSGAGAVGGAAGVQDVPEADRSQVLGLTVALPPPVRPLVPDNGTLGDNAGNDGRSGGGDDYEGRDYETDEEADGDADEDAEEDAGEDDAVEGLERDDKDDDVEDADGCGKQDADDDEESAVSGSEADSTDAGPDAGPEANLDDNTATVQQKHKPMLTHTTGDATLRAGVAHAVVALGRYRAFGARRGGAPRSGARPPQSLADDVFVVGRRPRRSVRLLVAMAQGCWIVGDAWLLDSLQSRAWKRCDPNVPSEFPGVLAARAASSAGNSLLNGMLVGSWGKLGISHDDFCMLVEAAGGQYASAGAAVIVQGDSTGALAADSEERAVSVNQLWLPDSISVWKVQAYDQYSAE